MAVTEILNKNKEKYRKFLRIKELYSANNFAL